ncbi:MAG: DNA polymerase III subunit beta [bacterium]
MKFSILQKELLNSLQKISSVVPVRSATPIAENILFTVEENKLQITGTDIEVSIRTEIPLNDSVMPGSVALPGKIITEMIRSLPDIPINFEANENNKVTITTEKGVYSISGISKENYPELPSLSDENSISIPSNKLKRMLTKTIFAVSSEELRPALMGVYFQIMKDELRMVATDGHRLSKIVDTNFGYDKDPVMMIIPPKAVQIAIKNFSEEGVTKIKFSNEALSFTFDSTVLYTRLVEGEYPDYEKVIPRDNEDKMTANKDLMIAATKRVSIFSSALTHQIRYSLSGKTLKIQSEDVDIGGEAQEELAIEYSGEDMDIGYNAEYILDILKHIDDDKVLFHLNSPVKASLITPTEQKENESFVMLIMPIKLSS